MTTPNADRLQLDVHRPHDTEPPELSDAMLTRVRGGAAAAGLGTASSSSSPALQSAQSQMQEVQMSLNLQYLALQQRLQNESRNFSMVSNIMKTRHDTAKNSISNVR